MSRLLLPLLCLLLAGCASTAPRTVAPQLPPMDASLAAPCVLPARPAVLDDYDAVDDWVQHQLLPALADCARRKAALVDAWERARSER